MPVASLAYRNAAEAIWHGVVPEKYTRLLPYLPASDAVLELGAAEGVLSLLMAENGSRVTALEMREDRHEEAKRLQARWLELGRKVHQCTMVLGDIWRDIDVLQGVHTFVAVRSIYYLRDNAGSVMAACAAAGVKRVVLCGNKNRAARWQRKEIPVEDGLGYFNIYASVPGMQRLLDVGGFKLEQILNDGRGDPIVTGYRP